MKGNKIMGSITIQHVRKSTRHVVTHFELTDELIQNNIHTFGNFHGLEDFHNAFFDTQHDRHAEAQEILSMIRPDQVYDLSMSNDESQWVSGDDVVSDEDLRKSKPLIPFEKGLYITV